MPTSSILRRLIAISLAGFAFAAQAEGTASDPRGRWITANGNLEVEVAPCGSALCGTVTKVLANRSMQAGGGEMKAADPASPLGMKLLRDFAPVHANDKAPAQWSGQIYNRENGKTYSCDMLVDTNAIAAGELVLRAYVGLPLFGKTQRWTRVLPETATPSPASAPTISQR